MPTPFKFKLALLFGVFCFLSALILNAPATLLAYALTEIKQQPFRLANAQGTVWKGQAALVLENEQQQLTLGQIAWHLNALALLKQHISAAIVWNNQAPAQLTIARQQFSIEHLDITMPASAIVYWVPSLNAAALGGKIQLTTEHMHYLNNTFEGSANVAWQHASAAMSKVSPLGHYALVVTGEGSQLALQLSTLSGPLQLSGNGTWLPQSGLSFIGAAAANSELEALSPLLHSIGNEQIANSGQFQFGL